MHTFHTPSNNTHKQLLNIIMHNAKNVTYKLGSKTMFT